jgi:polyisoprenoid-binding protein YceI
MESKKTVWTIDPTHSEVQFKVKHLVISTVTGNFKEFQGGLESNDEDFNGGEAHFEASIDSISTNQADRDNHLKSADFFDAENHPKLTFRQGKIEKTSNNEFTLNGLLSIRGVEKPVSLKAELGGIMDDPYGNRKAGFEISGKLSRKEFGLNWNAVTEAGGIVVGDEIKLQLNTQFVKQV